MQLVQNISRKGHKSTSMALHGIDFSQGTITAFKHHQSTKDVTQSPEGQSY